MKKVLAITAAFILAAIVLAPVMGYTINSTSPGPYSIKSGEMKNYSIGSGVPAHELTTSPLQGIIPGPSITVTPTHYSFTTAGPITNSFKLLGAANIHYNSLGMTSMPQAEALGTVSRTAAPAAPAAQAPVSTPAVENLGATTAAQNETAPAVTPAPTETPAPIVTLAPTVTPAPETTPAPAETTNVTMPTNATTNVTLPLNATANVTAPLNATAPGA